MTEPDDRPVDRPRRFLLAVAAGAMAYLALVWTAAILFDGFGNHWPETSDGSKLWAGAGCLWLIGTPEYQWPALWHGLWQRLPSAVLILGVAAGLWAHFAAGVGEGLKTRAGTARTYLALLLLGLACQLGPAAVHRMGMMELPLRVYLPDHTSYFTDSVKIDDTRGWIDSYPMLIDEFATHTRTHPPGATLVFHAVRKAARAMPGLSAAYARTMPRSEEAMRTFGLEAPDLMAGAVCALGLLLIAASAAPLTFAIGRIMVGEQRAAMAAALFALAPAFAHKTPILDHALGVLMLLSLYLALRAVRDKMIWLAAVAGGIVGLGLWLGTTMLAAPPMLAFYTLAAIWTFKKQDAAPRSMAILFVSLMVVVCGSALVTLFGIGAALGSDYLAVYNAITEIGWQINNQASGRHSTWLWIAWNPYEVMAFAGPPMAVCFIGEVVRQARAAAGGGVKSLDPWTLAPVVFLVALDLSGRVCYEWSRLAWFSFPLVAIAAARFVPAPGGGERRIMPIAILLGLQALSTIVFRMIF